MSAGDHRSVGELLVANDLIARSVLMDTEHHDARGLVGAWPRLAEAAEGFWSALPRAEREAGPWHLPELARDDLKVHGLAHMPGWSGPTSQDQRLVDMAANFERGEHLLRRHERLDGVGLAAPVVADREAAATRALHSIYVASHGVGVALRQAHDAQSDPAARRRSSASAGELATVSGLQRQFAGIEQTLGLRMGRRWPTGLEGEYREQPVQQRMREAMTVWDVQARRAMSDLTPFSASEVCQAQAVLLSNGHALLRAAALDEHVDPLEYRDRLAPALETVTGRLWAAGEVWRHLALPSDGIDPALRASAREVLAAVAEPVRDGAVFASHTTIQERVDLREVPQLMHRALITAAETAYGIREAVRSTELTGRARWVHEATVAAQSRLYAANVEPSPMKAWVSPNALRRNDLVSLPGVLKDDLAGQMGHVVSAADSVREAAANVLTRSPALSGREAQDRGVPTPAVTTPPPAW
ncbi:hypothetical protein ON003_00350 [Janibacter hoylei]|uniref:hypothetical protein n=1 Tax=Janibacter hoylei TaxID=364298 RepID=UPI0022375C3B|nr:hypothetical protein [Janibacter hoylei]MCW4600233.1 hypothetical protein [Janibacter hoylei]